MIEQRRELFTDLVFVETTYHHFPRPLNRTFRNKFIILLLLFFHWPFTRINLFEPRHSIRSLTLISSILLPL